jgi:hypothetical protein
VLDAKRGCCVEQADQADLAGAVAATSRSDTLHPTRTSVSWQLGAAEHSRAQQSTAEHSMTRHGMALQHAAPLNITITIQAGTALHMPLPKQDAQSDA